MSGTAEGWYELYVPDRGSMHVEFSTTADVLPARHLLVVIPSDQASAKQARGVAWAPVKAKSGGQLQLTAREREVMTAVASGLHGDDIAERLFVSPETVKSHVQNSMGKLGTHTRAHAVAIALIAGEISWEP